MLDLNVARLDQQLMLDMAMLEQLVLDVVDI